MEQCALLNFKNKEKIYTFDIKAWNFFNALNKELEFVIAESCLVGIR
jgi:hypothetical protein